MPSRAVMFSRWFLFFCLAFPLSALAAQQLIVEPDMGRGPLLQAITNANSSVDLVMYGFTDLTFLDALKTAKSQGKSVRILLQHYPYRAQDENAAVIRQIKASKMNLVWPDGDFQLTHQKTLLLDKQKAIVMTFNLTHSTFKNERNFALIITDQPLVTEIQKVFDADWQHQAIQPEQSDLVFSPDNSREKMLEFIRDAKQHLQIYAEGLSDYAIIGELAKAARRGVMVDIVTSPPREANTKPNRKFDYLRRAGVKIHLDTEYHIHAKVIIADENRALLGSINFTKPSMDSNRELSVITRDRNVIKQLESTFAYDAHQSTYPANADVSSVNDDVYQLIKRFNRFASKEYRNHHKKHKNLE